MHVHINDPANISDGYILLGDWRVRDDICFDGISRLDVRRMRLSREDSRIGVLVLGDSFLSAVAGRAQRGQRISMDAPIQPRAQDFGLIDEDLPRLERHWYPPVTAHGGPSPGATISVRWLKPGRLAILGVVLAALWIFLSTHSITLTALGTLLFGGGLGAIAGMIVAGLIVRPLYLLAATAWVPGFGAFRLFKHAQDAYQAALTKYQLWQQRTAVEACVREARALLAKAGSPETV